MFLIFHSGSINVLITENDPIINKTTPKESIAQKLSLECSHLRTFFDRLVSRTASYSIVRRGKCNGFLLTLDEKMDLHNFAQRKCDAKVCNLRSKTCAKVVNAAFAYLFTRLCK